MASNATISRYRPALAVLAALAAGYTIYYIHSSTRHPTTNNAAPLRRSRANNRRRSRPRQSRQQGQTALQDFPSATWGASRLMSHWMNEPGSIVGEYQIAEHHWRNDETPRTIPLERRPPSLTRLETEYGISVDLAGVVLRQYEEQLLRTFICRTVPPNVTLEDENGLAIFEELFAASGDLAYPSQVLEVINHFNRGDYDNSVERIETLYRHNVRQPEPSSIENQDRAIPEPTTDEPVDAMEEISQGSESSSDAIDGEERREGQSLLNMLYHIAEDQARRDGYVHRGISCNQCNTSPIHGVRYHCVNCPDYDLCETCEALCQHPKTHLFVKIRIPTPSFVSMKKPQPLWYPGKAINLPSSLNRELNKRLSDATGFSENEVEALWDQFKTLAATEWPEDPNKFHWAIDKKTFHCCFALWSGTSSIKPPVSLIYDRLFHFYDTNNDGKVGFEEFVLGMGAAKSKDPMQRLQRTFTGFDFDADGYVSRNDVMTIFKGCYALQKDIAQGVLADYEAALSQGGSLRETIEGVQLISASFSGAWDDFPRRLQRAEPGKVRNEQGELLLSNGHGVLASEETDTKDTEDVIGDLAELGKFGNIASTEGSPASSWQEAIKRVEEHENVPHSETPPDWPPANVEPRDVERVLGQSIPLEEIKSDVDRKKVLWAANQRAKYTQEQLSRRDTRDEAVRHRARRAEFHLDPTEPEQSTLEDVLMNDEHSERAGEGTAGLFRSPIERPSNLRQELLFQLTREGINKLVDPLFRAREDLSVLQKEYIRHFEACEEHLRAYRPEFLLKVLPSSKVRDSSMSQQDFISGWISCISYLQLKRYLKSVTRDSHVEQYSNMNSFPQFVEALFRSGTPAKEANHQDEQYVSTRLLAGMQADELRNHLESHIETYLKEQDSDQQRLAHELKEEVQPTPSLGSDASQPEESETEFPTPAVDLHEGVRVFNENDTSVEEAISKQDLDELLEESGYSIIDEPSTESMVESLSGTEMVPPLDLTLPQNRPNSLADIVEEPLLPTHIPSAFTTATGQQRIPAVNEPWSPEFKIFIAALHILQALHQEDKARGGAGRINIDEYRAVMNADVDKELAFLGQWIDMQAM